MEKLSKKNHQPLISIFLFILMGSLGSVASAFTSNGVTSYTASVKTGGVVISTEPVSLLHSPLQAVSRVTRLAVIQGEAGTNPPGNLLSSNNSGSTAASDVEIRVTVYYRVRPTGNTGPVPNFTALPTISGSDPMSFMFQITQSSITSASGVLEYKINVEKLRDIMGTLTVVGSTWHPKEVQTVNDDIAVSVGVQAGANAPATASGSVIVVNDGNPNDGNTNIEIPAGLFSGPTTVSITEIPSNSPILPAPKGFSDPVAFYSFGTDQPLGGNVKMTLLYQDYLNPFGVSGLGQDGILDGTGSSENLATIFWFDGFDWRPIGGSKNTNLNTIAAFVNQTGIYAIAAAPPIAPEDRRPMKRILTPNGDGINDTAVFTLGGVIENVEVEIFDMTGHRIRTIMSHNTFEWDGRDDSGKLVESGVYIYQYSLEGKRVSGLIAVAK